VAASAEARDSSAWPTISLRRPKKRTLRLIDWETVDTEKL
jgi:hypothetical protein